MRVIAGRLRLVPAILALCVVCAPVFAQDAGAPSEDFGVARVLQVTDEPAAGNEGLTQRVRLLIESGSGKGQTIGIENDVDAGRDDLRLRAGERVVVAQVTRADGSVEYQWRERYRLPGVLWLCAGFVVLVLLLGRRTGLTALLGLVASILALALVLVPRIAAGDDPLLISLVGSTAIACTSLYLAHGFNRRTSVALLSTLVSLALSVVLAVLSVRVGTLFGLGSDASLFLQSEEHAYNLRGLLLGGIVIGCLGVLDDITTAQTAVVDELRKANPSMTAAALSRAALSVGREHIASLINTLALAYAGASLPLLLLFRTEDSYPLWLTLNGEAIAEEIVRTLVGSATLLLAVPISTWFAVMLLKNAPPTPSTGHVHRH